MARFHTVTIIDCAVSAASPAAWRGGGLEHRAGAAEGQSPQCHRDLHQRRPGARDGQDQHGERKRARSDEDDGAQFRVDQGADDRDAGQGRGAEREQHHVDAVRHPSSCEERRDVGTPAIATASARPLCSSATMRVAYPASSVHSSPAKTPANSRAASVTA